MCLEGVVGLAKVIEAKLSIKMTDQKNLNFWTSHKQDFFPEGYFLYFFHEFSCENIKFKTGTSFCKHAISEDAQSLFELVITE